MRRPTSTCPYMLGALILAAAWAGALAGQQLPPSEVTFDPGKNVVDLPLETRYGLIVVPVEIDGISRPLRMILDTGAPVMVLTDPELAKAANFQVLAQALVDGSGDGPQETVPLVSGIQAAIGGVQVSKGLMLLGGIGRTELAIDGIIGRTLIDHVVVEADWEAGRLRLHDKTTFTYQGKGTELPLEIGANRHYVTDIGLVVDSEKRASMKVIVDTGARQALGLFRADALPAFGKGQLKDTIVSWGSRGPGRGEIGRVASLSLGGVLLTDVVTSVVDEAGRSAAGWLGLGVLERFRFFLDVPSGRILLEPRKTVGDPFAFNSTGLVISPPAPGAVAVDVVEVIGGSPAAAAGLVAGDRILQINGEKVPDLDPEKLTEILTRPDDGTDLSLGLERADRRIEASLRAKQLV